MKLKIDSDNLKCKTNKLKSYTADDLVNAHIALVSFIQNEFLGANATKEEMEAIKNAMMFTVSTMFVNPKNLEEYIKEKQFTEIFGENNEKANSSL